MLGMANYLQEILNKLQSISQPTPADWIGAIATAVSAVGAIVAALFAVLAYLNQSKRLEEQEKKTDEIFEWEKRRYKKELLKDLSTATRVNIFHEIFHEINRVGSDYLGETNTYKNISRIYITIKNQSDSQLRNIRFLTSLSLVQEEKLLQNFRSPATPSLNQPFTTSEGSIERTIISGDGQKTITRTIYIDKKVSLTDPNIATISGAIEAGESIEFHISIDSTDLNKKHILERISNSTVEFTDKNNLSWSKTLSGILSEITEYPESKS